MTWTYHRNAKAKCSKWVSGNNWVTKFDAGIICHVGINGVKDGIYTKTPAMCRAMVEYRLQHQ